MTDEKSGRDEKKEFLDYVADLYGTELRDRCEKLIGDALPFNRQRILLTAQWQCDVDHRELIQQALSTPTGSSRTLK